MLLFHGTSVNNAMNILKNGFNTVESIWTCSGYETYFFHEDFFRKEHGLETMEDVLDYGIREALGQSLITLAIQNPPDYRGAVLVFDSSLMHNKEEIEPDQSCEGMKDMAVALRNPDMNGLIGVYVMDQDMRSLRIFTLAENQDRPYINEVDLPSWEQQLVDAVSKNYVNTSDAYESISYSRVKFKQTKKRGLLKVA